MRVWSTVPVSRQRFEHLQFMRCSEHRSSSRCVYFCSCGKIYSSSGTPSTELSVSKRNTRDLALLSELDETKQLNSILQYHRFVVSKVLCTFSKRTAQITEKRTHALIYCRHSRIYPGRVNRKQWSKPDLGILFPGSYDVWSWSHSTLPAVRDPV